MLVYPQDEKDEKRRMKKTLFQTKLLSPLIPS